MTPTPSEYLFQYRSMDVQLVGGPKLLGVTIRRYRNAQDIFDKRNNDNDPANDVNGMSEELDAEHGWKTAWTALRGKITQHGESLGTQKYRVRFPLSAKGKPAPPATFDEVVNIGVLSQAFCGKGTPESCNMALRLAAAFGLVEPTLAAMQEYCDKYVGLDCNGFVGNYLRQKGCTKVTPDTPAYPAQFLAAEEDRVGSLEEIKPDSVLVWKEIGHVAIVDRLVGKIAAPPTFKTDILRCLVCESTGSRTRWDDITTNGLNYNTYEIHPPKAGKVFRVSRGLLNSNLSEVYIGNLT